MTIHQNHRKTGLLRSAPTQSDELTGRQLRAKFYASDLVAKGENVRTIKIFRGMEPVERVPIFNDEQRKGFSAIEAAGAKEDLRIFNKKRDKPPSGFQRDGTQLVATPGGPEDPGYLKKRTAATTKPKRPTLAQDAGNVSIQTARQDIMRAFERDGQPKETIRQFVNRVSKEASATGRDNPAYSPLMKQTFVKARQHAIGDDPEYGAFQALLDDPKPEAEPTPQPGEEPRPEAEGKSPIDRLKDFFGMDANEASTASKRPEGQAVTGGTQLPLTAGGRQIDVQRLQTGAVYEIPDKEGRVALYRWDGDNFVKVR